MTTHQQTRHTASSAPTVEDAERELQVAERHLEDLRARRVLGAPVSQRENAAAIGAVEFARDGIEAARRAEEARLEAERVAQLERLREQRAELDDAALEKSKAAAANAVGAYVDALLTREAALADVRASLGALGTWAVDKSAVDYQGVPIGATRWTRPGPRRASRGCSGR
jgi:hypothetical protein